MKPVVRTYKPGAFIFHENDHSRELYIIQTGQVKIFRTLNGREIPLAVLGKGSVLGEMSLIDGKPRSASARALDTCTVVLVDAESFESRTRGIPSWFLSIIRMTSEKVRKANDRLQRVHGSSTGINIVLALQYLIRSHGAAQGSELHLPSSLARSHLVQLLGLTLQRIQQVLEFLAKHGLLDITEGEVICQDPGRFEDYCRFLRLHLRKGLEGVHPATGPTAAVVMALPRQVPQVLQDPGMVEVSGETFWPIMQGAGAASAPAQVIDDLKNNGLMTIKKVAEPVEENPLAGAAFSLRTEEWTKCYLLASFGALIPAIARD